MATHIFLAHLRPCLALALTCVSGDPITTGPQRHIVVYLSLLCVSSGFELTTCVVAHIASSRRSVGLEQLLYQSDKCQISIFHYKRNVFQTTTASGLSDQITMHIGSCLHLYLALFSCDQITQDTCNAWCKQCLTAFLG